MTPEILALKNPELPHFVEDSLRRPLALAGSVLAVAGIGLAGNVDEAKAAPEICTAPTGEVPTPQVFPKKTGVDLMTYKPALSTNPCVGYDSVVSTFIQNTGTKTAVNVRAGVTGRKDIVQSIVGVKIDERPVEIRPTPTTPMSGEYCEWSTYPLTDRNGIRTVSLNCNYVFQRNLNPNEKMKVEYTFRPKTAFALDPSDKGPYLSVTTGDFPYNDVFSDNNFGDRNIFALDSQGNPASPPQPNPKACTPPAFNILYSKKNKTVTFAMKARGNKISGIGNGVAKSVNERSRATRMLVDVKAGTKLAPNQPAVIQDGRKVIVDLPNAGVTKTKYTTRTIRTKTFNGLGKFGKAFVPKGKLPGCNKDLIVYAQLINKDLKK